jgi:hypothetical protein
MNIQTVFLHIQKILQVQKHVYEHRISISTCLKNFASKKIYIYIYEHTCSNSTCSKKFENININIQLAFLHVQKCLQVNIHI